MDYINKVELQGVIGEVTDTAPIIQFSLCTSHFYKGADSSLIETTWHLVKADILNIKGVPEKGKFAHVIGRIKASKYCDLDGKEHYNFYILANKVMILD